MFLVASLLSRAPANQIGVFIVINIHIVANKFTCLGVAYRLYIQRLEIMKMETIDEERIAEELIAIHSLRGLILVDPPIWVKE